MSGDAAGQTEEEIRQIINSLYQIIVSAADYPSSDTSITIRSQLLTLLRSLSRFSEVSQHLGLSVPADVIAYVEAGRNPDIYTREFVEATQRLNQERKGKSESYAAFRDVLANEIATEMPDLKYDVQGVLDRTSG